VQPSGDDKVSYVYDPRDPVKTVGGNNLMLDHGPMDQRAIGSRKDVLKFETEPLKQAVEVVGPLSAELMVSTDAADTDFMVKLVDVYPNGYEAIVKRRRFSAAIREWIRQAITNSVGCAAQDQSGSVVNCAGVQRGP
jgi:putative CocE/NonD family hydrolase